ncbi:MULTISPECIES: RHS repeat domain-containing protein [unclassified Treponema]|uniref:RHS repeat domain-containing protein n=1 Tax=unclassified Treponema TaxID=2638727 RepID=UPI00273A6754|nr:MULTISPECIES: RHS repeat-associated core domain-containing protein [unclassified Treponema]
MKISYLFNQPNHITTRTAIVREQKQFIQIAFAVHLSAAISAERYRSDSGALKSAVPILVYFYIIMINKYRQSAKRKLLLNSSTDRTFENRWSRYKEPSKNKAEAYRVYVEHLFLRSDAGDARIFSKEMTHADNNGDTTEQTEKRYYYHADHLQSAQFITDWNGMQYEHIEYTPYGELWIEETAPGIDKLPFRFTGKELDEETGLYYYGARYLDPKYSRWLSGDPALNDYMAGSSVGEGGIYNTVNFNVYHYGGNNPIKYTDPTGMWDAKNEWNSEFQKKYEDYISLKISEYEKNKKRFTCEDLALSILIDFASENSLPLNIKNNSGTYNSSDNKYSDPEKYKKDVLSSTAAHDLMQNTVAVDKKNISPGDLILMDTGTPNGTKDNKMSHTQVVTENKQGIFTIKQGNFLRGSSKYGAFFYGGTMISERTLDTNRDVFKGAGNNEVPNASNAFGINYRRWDFGAWKK